MEKIEVKIKTIEEATHYFYCDDCNKHLGETHEYEDGWYQNLGEFELKIYMPDGWYKINKCLCDDCRNKFLKEVEQKIIELGFKKE